MELLLQDHDTSFVAWAIRFITGSRYHHCALLIDGYIWEALRTGHHRVSAASELDRFQTRVPVTGDDHGAILVLAAHLTDTYGYVDGFWGAVRSLAQITWGQLPWTSTVASNCSHYAALGLVGAGNAVPPPLASTTPGDLARWGGAETPCTSLSERWRRARGA